MDEYRFPDPNELKFTKENKTFLQTADRENHLVFGTLFYFMFESLGSDEGDVQGQNGAKGRNRLPSVDARTYREDPKRG